MIYDISVCIYIVFIYGCNELRLSLLKLHPASTSLETALGRSRKVVGFVPGLGCLGTPI